ncbi:FecCD family ABC transporter permease [Paludibacterium yongneupense]|uniref:FecCD family ABC transporter permease n=1 Tax=Paludibacterium yongneupense TaxID=400061 RepID=UPI00041A8119|nr:iron ABC transporter permease [Paludibacterium yongneupense]
MSPVESYAAVPVSDSRSHYQRQVAHKLALLAVLVSLCALAMALDLAIGSETLSLHQVVQGLLHPQQVAPEIRVVLWDIRLPVTLTAAIAGAGLALSGSLMQTVLDNPLAEPFTLGISAAAGFGAALAIVFQASALAFLPLPAEFIVTGNAFLFSLLTVICIGLFAARTGLAPEMVVLLGIAVHFIFTAMLGMAQYLADADQLQALVFWMMGSLMKTGWRKVEILFVIVGAAVPVLGLLSWRITALRGFGSQAAVLGVAVKHLRMALLLLAALMASSITATIGVVGFIGLVAPHMARMLVGEDQRFSLALTAACGALVLTLASIFSKTVFPGAVLPIGMVTSLLGVPFFLWLLLGHRARRF